MQKAFRRATSPSSAWWATRAAGVVEFEIADKASVKDVLLQYARAAKLGWTMRARGHS